MAHLHHGRSPTRRRALPLLALGFVALLGGCIAYPAAPGYGYGYGPGYGYAPAYGYSPGVVAFGGGWGWGGWHRWHHRRDW